MEFYTLIQITEELTGTPAVAIVAAHFLLAFTMGNDRSSTYWVNWKFLLIGMPLEHAILCSVVLDSYFLWTL